MKKEEKMPKRTVKIPSRMKIQAQPGLPPIPDISEIPAARRPLNAPAKDEAAKTTDKLFQGIQSVTSRYRCMAHRFWSCALG